VEESIMDLLDKLSLNFPKGLRNNAKDCSLERQSPGYFLNLGPLKYKEGIIPHQKRIYRMINKQTIK
jgi:hypothetical protein